MTEHDCDACTTSSSSNNSCRSTSESSTDSPSSSPRSCSSVSSFEEEDRGFVNLLTDKTFHNEIINLAKKRKTIMDNHLQHCTLDNKNRIVSVGDNDLLRDHEFLMDIALLASARSDDPKTKVGACIVDSKNRIVGIGYNHFPPNYTNEPYSWGKDKWDRLDNKLTYVIHAESDAIIGPQQADLCGATIYSTLMPCNECAKLIIQSGIKNVYYLNSKSFEKWIYEASRRMLNAARIKLQKLE